MRVINKPWNPVRIKLGALILFVVCEKPFQGGEKRRKKRYPKQHCPTDLVHTKDFSLDYTGKEKHKPVEQAPKKCFLIETSHNNSPT